MKSRKSIALVLFLCVVSVSFPDIVYAGQQDIRLLTGDDMAREGNTMTGGNDDKEGAEVTDNPEDTGETADPADTGGPDDSKETDGSDAGEAGDSAGSEESEEQGDPAEGESEESGGSAQSEEAVPMDVLIM